MAVEVVIGGLAVLAVIVYIAMKMFNKSKLSSGREDGFKSDPPGTTKQQ